MEWIVTVQRIDGGLGMVFPDEWIERQSLGDGDTLVVVEREDGLLLAPRDPKFDKVMEAYGDLSRRYRNTLRELAE
ncbi:MAG: AbrB/MazE/SpoVT family DNA-binding domain-containing protein [Longimicrobiaceae bacterium]